MQTIGGDYSTIISGQYKIDTHFIIDGVTYTMSDVKSASIDGMLFQELGIGNAMTRTLKLNLKGTPNIPRGATIQVQQQVFNKDYPLDWTNTSQMVPKGTFFISKRNVNRKANVTEITAYDAMNKMDVPYMESGDLVTKTAKAVVEDICTDVSVTLNTATATVLNDGYLISSPPVMGEEGTTRRQMLQQIGILYGGNWTITDDGKLTLIQLAATPTPTVVGSRTGSCINQAPLSAIDRVKLINGNSAFESDDFSTLTGAVLICNSNYASADNANRVLAKVEDYVYQPYEATRAYVEPAAGLGDRVTIYGLTSVIARQAITISRTCPSDIGADYEGEEDDEYKYVPPVEREIVQSEARSQASISVLEQSIDSQVSQINETLNGENGVVQSISNLQQTANSFTLTLTNINADLTEMQQYLTYENGVLTLGETGSPFKAQLDNTQLAFVQNGNIVAYVSNNKLYITNAEITDNLQIGKYQWITQSDGRMSLKWVG